MNLHALVGAAVTRLWAFIKLLVAAATGPVWSTAIATRAWTNHRRAKELTSRYPDQLTALIEDRQPTGANNEYLVLPSEMRAFVSSDLHRCIPGRIDHSARLDTKYLYEAALDHYADRGFHLIENGDVEDFWMVGGTMEGTRYDISRMAAGLIPGPFGRRLRTTIRNRQLDQIVDNNLGIYRRIRNRFAADGRYWRTIGNHDDVYADPTLRQHLRTHLPGARPVNHLVLRSRAGSTSAVITHGHHTDGWNAPGRANLGRLASWAACTLTDLPFLSTPEGLPTREESAAILAGTASNSLVAVDPLFGANRHYDSLDEELLFSAVSPHLDRPPRPWLLFGHTHFPVYEPLSRTGLTWKRYANSGTGLLWGVVTGLEWDGTGDEPRVQLVAWSWANDDTAPERIVSHHRGRAVARTELVALTDEDGRAVIGPAASPAETAGQSRPV